ncbi:MAG: DUF423 domain-containing protein [Flavisolibacter sp.]|jgi:uncharacterized membrane protein YgdD (TMEM256/DUF423 family)|nr:DUF423 domain-containing protein [Flavisolibacter sp.]
MYKIFLVIGTVLGGLGVALGAFGAHGLKKIVSAQTVATYQTGVQYQMYHVFALLMIGFFAERYFSSLVHYAGVFFIAGIVLFSGSLYLAVSLEAMNKQVPTLVRLITPVGGMFFIIGWILLLLGIIRK